MFGKWINSYRYRTTPHRTLSYPVLYDVSLISIFQKSTTNLDAITVLQSDTFRHSSSLTSFTAIPLSSTYSTLFLLTPHALSYLYPIPLPLHPSLPLPSLPPSPSGTFH